VVARRDSEGLEDVGSDARRDVGNIPVTLRNCPPIGVQFLVVTRMKGRTGDSKVFKGILWKVK
jgi:hypothetical protein